MPDAPAGGLVVRLVQSTPIPLDCNFTCAPGELVALVGPSGAGKSTVLRCIAGLHSPSQGRITCDGTTWFDGGASVDLPPQRRRAGLVFQNYALFPHLNARDNIAAALGHLPQRERTDRAQALLARVHLDGLEKRRPSELSGGQQQRVAVARALAREPAVLLLDEPFSAVDQVTRRKLHRELAQLRRRLSMPIVLVTHDLDEARELADTLVILHRGRSLQAGPPLKVTSRPHNALVARLVDLPNIFDGVVVEQRVGPAATLLRWKGLVLEARIDRTFPKGSPVSWVIPPSHIVLHRRDRPSRGERENPVRGRVIEALRLGETTSVVLEVGGDPAARLHFSVPTHVADRNGLVAEVEAAVSLLAEGIHLMPPEDATATR